MIELKDCGSSTSQQTTTEHPKPRRKIKTLLGEKKKKAQIKQHYEKERERKKEN